jgi:opine dehydrogenase
LVSALDIAVLGGGNGGFAAAVDFGLRDFPVRLWSRSEDTIAPIRVSGGIRYSGALGEGFQAVGTASSDMAEVIEGADVVVIMVPTQAHEEVAARAARHLKPEQILIAAPGHTVLLIPHVMRQAGIERPVMGDIGSLPYICRKQAPDAIAISQKSKAVSFAAFPGRELKRLERTALTLYPAIKPVASVLETVFPYTNAIHHPPALLMNAGRIEATGGDYYHYYDGISPAVGRVIDELDGERRSVATAFGIETKSLAEEFFARGYTTQAACDSGLAYEVFHQSEPDRWIRAPDTIEHRFVHEDVPFGLVLLSELGRFADVPTPAADHMIELAGVALRRDYRKHGLTLERMGLADVDRTALPALLADGYGVS